MSNKKSSSCRESSETCCSCFYCLSASGMNRRSSSATSTSKQTNRAIHRLGLSDCWLLSRCSLSKSLQKRGVKRGRCGRKRKAPRANSFVALKLATSDNRMAHLGASLSSPPLPATNETPPETPPLCNRRKIEQLAELRSKSENTLTKNKCNGNSIGSSCAKVSAFHASFTPISRMSNGWVDFFVIFFCLLPIFLLT